MDEEEDVVAAVEQVLKERAHNFTEVVRHVQLIETCGTSGGTMEANNLPRLNAAAQDCLSALRSAQLRLDLLAQQQPTDHQIDSCQNTLQAWKDEYQSLQLKLRNANLKAKANIQKAAQEERELLLGGGEESTIRRRNLETKAGMTVAAESITQGLRRARQMMVQEVERGASTLATIDQSTGTLIKAETEYKGHRSLLMSTRHLLTTMRRQDILDRIIMGVGFVFFCLVVLYIFTKRVGLLKLQRKLSASMRSDHPEINLASDYPQHANSPYFVKENMKVTIGTSEKMVSMDASPSSAPAFLDSSIHQTSDSNPVNSDVHIDIDDGKETKIHLTSSDPSFLTKNSLPQTHDEL
ncbi:hypothetical protein SUGI_1066350 [Cryptomeria japonica]|uniref:uncharacterized protein LOC131029976 n=1 Tax=Cryptomeria japonica TaxID=3369 RepID=UPI002414930C|nr:uncharacterized protein LOC131029976 [Cryptomeria japonica]GLJ50119.1 hypothetical protein SUGI_1066350 [Cryptomeria japonica]